MNQELLMNPNSLVAALEKPAAEFTKADIISFIQKNNIRMAVSYTHLTLPTKLEV